MDRGRIVEIERAWASAERDIVDSLHRLDPSWGSATFAVADGWAVLAGPGLYTNCLLGVGLTADVTADDLACVEDRAAEVGVPAALQISEATRLGLEEFAAARNYEAVSAAQVVVHDLRTLPDPGSAIVVEPIDEAQLGRWQVATAEGRGHESPEARAASDVYAAAAQSVDRPGLMLARSADDGRALGAATLRVAGGFATLGGMSTLPAERNTGVQRALIGHRLHLARAAGCRYAASVAAPGGASLRNLVRLGFEPSHTKTLWVRR